MRKYKLRILAKELKICILRMKQEIKKLLVN